MRLYNAHFLIFCLLTTMQAHSQCVFTSTGTTAGWNTASSWSPSVDCGVTAIPNVSAALNHHVVIGHAITRADGFSIDHGSSITINNGGTLTTSASLTLGQNANPQLVVNNGGTLAANAGLEVQTNNTFNNHGIITGTNITLQGANTSVSNTGTINITGDLITNGSRTFTNTGPIRARDINLGGGGVFNNSGNLIVTRDLILTNKTFNNSADINANKIVLLGSSVFNSTGGIITTAEEFDMQASSSINFTGGELNARRFLFRSNVESTLNIPTTISQDIEISTLAQLNIGGVVETQSFLNSGGGRVLLTNTSSVLAIEGLLNQTSGSANIVGVGSLTWGSYSSIGTSYIKCNGGDETQWNAPTEPPFNPLDLGICGLNTTLPVEFGNLKINYSNNQNRVIEWETYTEKNNSFFSILRSNDGVNFIELGTVAGAGNSHQLLKYSYIDDKPINGNIIYYRIAQTDYDGTTTYSKIVSLLNNISSSSTINIYPNPITGNSFSIELIQKKDYEISITDLKGMILPSTIYITENNILVQFDTKPESGIYLINTISADDKQTHRIIVK